MFDDKKVIKIQFLLRNSLHIFQTLFTRCGQYMRLTCNRSLGENPFRCPSSSFGFDLDVILYVPIFAADLL